MDEPKDKNFDSVLSNKFYHYSQQNYRHTSALVLPMKIAESAVVTLTACLAAAT